MHNTEIHLKNELESCKDWKKVRSLLEQGLSGVPNTYSIALQSILDDFNTNTYGAHLHIQSLLQVLPSRHNKSRHQDTYLEQYDCLTVKKQKVMRDIFWFVDFFKTKVEIICKDNQGQLDQKSQESIMWYIEQIDNRINSKTSTRSKQKTTAQKEKSKIQARNIKEKNRAYQIVQERAEKEKRLKEIETRLWEEKRQEITSILASYDTGFSSLDTYWAEAVNPEDNSQSGFLQWLEQKNTEIIWKHIGLQIAPKPIINRSEIKAQQHWGSSYKKQETSSPKASLHKVL